MRTKELLRGIARVAEVDGDKVRRVFMNLLSNAFKYAPNAMSGFGMETDVASTRAAGFAEYLVKPVAAEKLCDLLARFRG